jgi:hypothetical protein
MRRCCGRRRQAAGRQEAARLAAGRQESSFCESATAKAPRREKEAKKLFVLPCVDAGARRLARDGTKGEKFFWFFFFKKRTACLTAACLRFFRILKRTEYFF